MALLIRGAIALSNFGLKHRTVLRLLIIIWTLILTRVALTLLAVISVIAFGIDGLIVS